jgi:hypothetical protein
MHKLTNIVEETRKANCSECDGIVSIVSKGPNRWRCATQRRAYQTRPDRVLADRNRNQAKYFNLDVGELLDLREDLLDSQDSKCGICGVLIDDDTAKLDHEHETGRIRGLLCTKCNTGLGKLGDSIEGLERALAYLKAH